MEHVQTRITGHVSYACVHARLRLSSPSTVRNDGIAIVNNNNNYNSAMNKSLEPDLISLLPSLAGPIPTELVNLATSLLAQSRSRISNLKPQEEVARSYVCAHIACNR